MTSETQSRPTPPTLDLVSVTAIHRRRSAPLHAQIEEALHEIIDRYFRDGDVFFKELEIAEHLGVSRPTVRQALGSLTRKGLLDRRPFIGTIVTKPAQAPAQAPAPTKHVSIFVTNYASEIIAMCLQQFMEESRRRDLAAHAHYVNPGEKLDLHHRHALHGPDQERCIVYADQDAIEQLQEAGYRTLSLNPPSADYAGLAVETDARMAAQIGVDYLRSLGHEKITLLVNEPAVVTSVQDKIAQFRATLPGGQVLICGTQLGESSYTGAYENMARAWAGRPTAIMTTSDPGAWAAMHWLAEQGVSVPAEVSILGFEDARSSQFLRPALSTIAHPLEAIARTALDVLMGDDQNAGRILLPPDLIIRDSTGPRP